MPENVDILIDEFLNSRSLSASDELAQIEVALYIEECLGVTIADEEIGSATLGDPRTIREFARSKAAR